MNYKEGACDMITEEQVDKIKFYTTDGTDIWQVQEIVKQVRLKSLQTGKEELLQIGAVNNYIPVIMPQINPPQASKTKGKIKGQTSVSSAEPKMQKARPLRACRGRLASKLAGAKTMNGPKQKYYSGKKQARQTGAYPKILSNGSTIYYAQVTKDGKQYHLGNYDDYDKAIEVADNFRRTGQMPERPSRRKPPPRKKGFKKSQYFGVSPLMLRHGVTYRTQIWDPEKKISLSLGVFKDELIAAAKVQEYIGNHDEARRLRSLSQSKEINNKKEIQIAKEISQLRGEDGPKGHLCRSCGETYDTRPDKCPKCSSLSFDEIALEQKMSEGIARPGAYEKEDGQ
jgi:hypothetical protein